jgi:hypothetical protein
MPGIDKWLKEKARLITNHFSWGFWPLASWMLWLFSEAKKQLFLDCYSALHFSLTRELG